MGDLGVAPSHRPNPQSFPLPLPVPLATTVAVPKTKQTQHAYTPARTPIAVIFTVYVTKHSSHNKHKPNHFIILLFRAV